MDNNSDIKIIDKIKIYLDDGNELIFKDDVIKYGEFVADSIIKFINESNVKRVLTLEKFFPQHYSRMFAVFQGNLPKLFSYPNCFSIKDIINLPQNKKFLYIFDLDDTLLNGNGLNALPFPGVVDFLYEIDFIVLTSRNINSQFSTYKQLGQLKFPLCEIYHSSNKARFIKYYCKNKWDLYQHILFIDDNIYNVYEAKNVNKDLICFLKIPNQTSD